MTFASVPADDRNAIILLAYCVLIVVASLMGGWLPQRLRLTHTRMQVVISFVGGLMLGIGLFHMLPHSVAELGSVDRSVWWMMVGIVTMFFLLRLFHFHHHGPAEVCESACTEGDGHDAACGHAAHADTGNSHSLSWAGVALGLGVHTLLDGIALAASIEAESLHETQTWLLGLGTFLAIVLHKPLDAASITALMASGGWTPGWQRLINGAFALMCPLGAALFVLGVKQMSGVQHTIIGGALAFSAGVFLCISMGDLLPELGFHSHDRLKLSIALLLGIAAAYAIGSVESDAMHQHDGGRAPAHGPAHPNEHLDGHDHGT